MFPLPDGTLRHSSRDLVAYLEGDFAAWCERMAAERARAGGAGPAEQTWVPAVCRFVSEAVHDGRLGSIPETGRHRVIRGPDTALIPAETGIVWVHDVRCRSVEEMRLVNLLCHLVQYAEERVLSHPA